MGFDTAAVSSATDHYYVLVDFDVACGSEVVIWGLSVQSTDRA
jgi:hypothetical protein